MAEFSRLELNRFLSFSEYSAFRENQVLNMKNLVQRMLFAIRDFFFGAGDQVAFCRFYERMRGNIQLLDHALETPTSDTFDEIQTLLKIRAQIEVSLWGANLKDSQNQAYLLYQEQLSQLQIKARPKARLWANEIDPKSEAGKVRNQVARWIEANSHQLHSAARLESQHVPYRYEEIPAGAVILTNPKTYFLQRHVKKTIPHFLRSILIKIKAFLSRILTGKHYTHASLCLGNGYLFDLDKKSPLSLSGEGKILHKSSRVCNHHIVFPDTQKMVTAYNARFPQQRVTTFEELWSKIEKEAREKVHLVKGGILDLLKLGFCSKRANGYDSVSDWNPDRKNYVCSASIGALLGSFGIDIGKELNKENTSLLPSDFLKSSFFRAPPG